MDIALKGEIAEYRHELCERLERESRRLKQLDGYGSRKLKIMQKEKKRYYSTVEFDGKVVYLGNDDNREVKKIKEAHFLQASLKELKHEITLLDQLLCKSRDISYGSINNSLRKAYRGAEVQSLQNKSDIAREWKAFAEYEKSLHPPFMPERLIHKTHDGTMVRSKSEALIYNTLLELGVTFVYELPIRIRVGNKDFWLLPDFTILSERDYKTVIYLEHQGMMSTQQYRDKFNDTVYKYWTNGYLPERDVFFTFDLPNGGFDDVPIKDIIHRHIRRL